MSTDTPYEALMRHVYENGVGKGDRTGIKSVFGHQMRFMLNRIIAIFFVAILAALNSGDAYAVTTAAAGAAAVTAANGGARVDPHNGCWWREEVKKEGCSADTKECLMVKEKRIPCRWLHMTQEQIAQEISLKREQQKENDIILVKIVAACLLIGIPIVAFTK